MRWDDGRESSNVDDDRGDGDGGGGGGGFGFGGGGGLGGLGGLLALLPLLGGGGGGLVILVIIGLVIFGGPLLRGGGGNAPAQRAPSGYQGPGSTPGATPGADPQAQDLRFVKVIAGYTEDTWGEIFREQGRTYSVPRFTIYSRGHATACGYGQTAMGPFYCPGDRRVYLDLGFFRELSDRFGAPGDFAKAYVVAHEVGHHVQNLLGQMDRGGSGETRNETSVRTELQADCYAGVWAAVTNRLHQGRIMEAGDLESGLQAAKAVGDDTLQRESQGRVQPDSFTHGSAAQRQRWLRTGYDSGDIARCDTWSPAYSAL